MGRVELKKNARKSLSSSRGNSSSGKISKSNVSATESTKDRIARMKEAKLKYSQISQTRAGTGKGATVFVAPKIGGPSRIQRPKEFSFNAVRTDKVMSVTIQNNKRADVFSSENRRESRSRASTFGGFGGSSIDDGFKTNSASLNLIKNNRSIPTTTGRMSTYGCARISIARPSMLPGGLNYFDESNSRSDKKLIQEFMDNVAPRTPGRQSLAANGLGLGGSVDRLTGAGAVRNNKVRFVMEDTIKETRESAGSELGNDTPVRSTAAMENCNPSLIQSILKRPGNAISRSAMKILNGEIPIPTTAEKEQHVNKTPKLRRSTRRSVLFNSEENGLEQKMQMSGSQETIEEVQTRLKGTAKSSTSPPGSTRHNYRRNSLKDLKNNDSQTETDCQEPLRTPEHVLETTVEVPRSSSRSAKKRGTFTKNAITDITCVYSIWFAGSEEQRNSMPIEMMKGIIQDMQKRVAMTESIDSSKLNETENTTLPPLEITGVEEELLQAKEKKKLSSKCEKVAKENSIVISPILRQKNAAQTKKSGGLPFSPIIPDPLNRRLDFEDDDETY